MRSSLASKEIKREASDDEFPLRLLANQKYPALQFDNNRLRHGLLRQRTKPVAESTFTTTAQLDECIVQAGQVLEALQRPCTLPSDIKEPTNQLSNARLPPAQPFTHVYVP